MRVICRLLVLVLAACCAVRAGEIFDTERLLQASSLSINALTAEVTEVQKRETCCRKQYRLKTIEHVLYQNNVEYKCHARVLQAFCAGDCQTDTTYVPGLFTRNSDGRITWITRPSYSNNDRKYCRIQNPVSRQVRVRCQAQKDCCETVAQEEFYVTVTINEPGDCECIDGDRPPKPTCRLIQRSAFHRFWLDDNTYCRTATEIRIPYCSGTCNSRYYFWDFRNPLHLFHVGRYCRCCSALSYGYMYTGVYCWMTNTGWLRDDRVTVTDGRGNSLNINQRNIFNNAWYAQARIRYIRQCYCEYRSCQ